MARPFRGYRELAAEGVGSHPGQGTAPSIATGVFRFLLVVGAFVTLTATGRFAPIEAATAMVSFSWLPLVHAVGMGITRRIFVPQIPYKRVFALYLEALGPWMFVFLILSGSCLFAPHPAKPVFALLGPLLGIASLWSIVIVFAMFRSALNQSRLRSAAATATFYVLIHALILTYYLAMGQLWPIL